MTKDYYTVTQVTTVLACSCRVARSTEIPELPLNGLAGLLAIRSSGKAQLGWDISPLGILVWALFVSLPCHSPLCNSEDPQGPNLRMCSSSERFYFFVLAFALWTRLEEKKKKKPGFFHKSCFSRAALCFRRLENWNFIWVLPLYNSFTYFHSCFLTPPGLGTHRWGENASRIRLFPKP